MSKLAVNPFFVGNEFMNYCIKNGWMELSSDEDKRLHYYATEEGQKVLAEQFGIHFTCPCALESENA